jgi:hypothetical protein
MTRETTVADEATLRKFAGQAHADLCASGHAEFGEDTRMAILDTAGDALADAGFEFDRETLVRIAGSLA